MIRPSGFYNQKAERLFEFCRFVVEGYGSLDRFFKLPVKEAREKLLSINGIGKETADTILLYAGGKPVFVIDAYTKEFASTRNLFKETDHDTAVILGIRQQVETPESDQVVDSGQARMTENAKLTYDSLQQFFTKNLPTSTKLYQDYHALIVRWGKEN